MKNPRTIVITGAASGIGEALAREGAAQGYGLALWDIDEVRLLSLQEKLEPQGGASISIHPCDVSDQISVEQAVRATVEQHSHIDVLINNAGIAHVGTVETTSGDDLDRLYAVNIKGVYHGMHAVVPLMKERNEGVILNLASIASKIGIPDRFAYSMTKGAVLTMTLSVARDYVDSGIRCNCLCPGRVHTPFVDNFVAANYPGEEELMMEKLSQSQPIGRMGEPAEIAKLALYLCSDDAAFITGSAYDIDGGSILLR